MDLQGEAAQRMFPCGLPERDEGGVGRRQRGYSSGVGRAEQVNLLRGLSPFVQEVN